MKLLGHLFAVLVALPLLLAGAAKLAGEPTLHDSFVRWGYPTWLRLVTGCLEIIAALMVLLPFSRLVGAGLAIAVMVAAAGTHGLHGEYGQMLPPLLVALFSVGAGLVGRGQGR